MLGSKKYKPVVFNVAQGVAPPYGMNKKRQILVAADLPNTSYPDIKEPPQVTKTFVDTRPPPIIAPPSKSLPPSSPYGSPPPISAPPSMSPPPLSPYGSPPPPRQLSIPDVPPPMSPSRGGLYNSRGNLPIPLSIPSSLPPRGPSPIVSPSNSQGGDIPEWKRKLMEKKGNN